jgi:hypothetical protein
MAYALKSEHSGMDGSSMAGSAILPAPKRNEIRPECRKTLLKNVLRTNTTLRSGGLQVQKSPHAPIEPTKLNWILPSHEAREASNHASYTLFRPTATPNSILSPNHLESFG